MCSASALNSHAECHALIHRWPKSHLKNNKLICVLRIVSRVPLIFRYFFSPCLWLMMATPSLRSPAHITVLIGSIRFSVYTAHFNRATVINCFSFCIISKIFVDAGKSQNWKWSKNKKEKKNAVFHRSFINS